MSYRRVILLLFSATFMALIWVIVVNGWVDFISLAKTLVTATVITLMLPESRLRIGEALKGLSIWKGNKSDP